MQLLFSTKNSWSKKQLMSWSQIVSSSIQQPGQLASLTDDRGEVVASNRTRLATKHKTVILDMNAPAQNDV